MTSQRAMRGYTALLLAGRRSASDPLAAAAGAPHRALLDVGGVPMLERVLRTLVETPCIGDIVISIDRPELLESYAGIAQLRRDQRGHIAVLRSADSPSRSVLQALDDGSPEQPLLVTTADHALLRVEMIEHFLGEAETRGGDVSVALVAESLLRERFPESVRTYLPFAGERYSGANLFALLTPRARRAVEFWTRAESFRKRPWRLVASFGPAALLYFLLRRFDLDTAFERASDSIGARVVAVTMPFAEAAVDVDKLSDLELVNRILADEDAGHTRVSATGDDPVDDSDPAARARPTDAEPAATADADQIARSSTATKPPLATS
jgi:GTP:adenosylcobinamide-phosphate guanylyltransferase